MRILLLLIFFVGCKGIHAQKKTIDSLLFKIENAKSDSAKLNGLNKLFNVYNSQNSDSAQIVAEKALVLARKLDYPVGRATSYNNLGTVFYYKGNNTKALANYLSALKILENLSGKVTKSSAYNRQLSSCYNNIGMIYQRQKLFDKAEDYFLKSIEIDRLMGDKKGMAHAYNNIGTIKEETNKYDEAIKNYEIAMQLKIEIKDTVGIPSTLINIGILQMNNKKFKESEEYFKRALSMSRKASNKQDEALALINMGDMFYLKKNYDKAVEYYRKGIELSENQHYDQFLIYAHNSLSLAYYRMKKFEKAYDQFQLYVTIKDSLYNLENAKALHEMETKYETDVHEKEIDLLTAEKSLQDLELNNKMNLIYFFVGGFILLIVLLVLLLNAYVIKRKNHSELDSKNQKIELAYGIIEQKQKEIVDSINYAKRIQYTLLAHKEYLEQNLYDHFMLYKPKDIVSGDFYWATKQDNKFFLAVCDSTGHGVPGAFMSLLNIGFLSEAINEKGIYKPNEVFNYVRKRLSATVSHEGQQDGFDGILICLDRENGDITYAAANNSPVLISNGELKILPKDKMPVGIGEKVEDFSLYSVNTEKGAMLYLMTDGYADQFGGPKGKKMMHKRLDNLLLEYHSLPLTEQFTQLEAQFEEWRGDLEQVDDVCLLGMRITSY